MYVTVKEIKIFRALIRKVFLRGPEAIVLLKISPKTTSVWHFVFILFNL